MLSIDSHDERAPGVMQVTLSEVLTELDRLTRQLLWPGCVPAMNLPEAAFA